MHDNDSLAHHLCGGEDGAEQPQSSCWVLDNQSQETTIWRHHRNMTSLSVLALSQEKLFINDNQWL